MMLEVIKTIVEVVGVILSIGAACWTIGRAIVGGFSGLQKQIGQMTVALEKIRGDLKKYVTHGQCSQKRHECPCVKELAELKQGRRSSKVRKT